MAVIQVETGGFAYRTRFEDHYRWGNNFQHYATKLGITYMTEYVHQKTSWGLMQIMGGTARECGFELHLPMLCLPEHGIWWGTYYLDKQLKRYSDSINKETDALAAYNAGKARRDKFGKYKNQDYVDKVLKAVADKLWAQILNP